MKQPESAFQRIGIVAKPDNVRVADTLIRLLEFLEPRGVELMLETVTYEMVSHPRVASIERGELGTACDLVIVVGGDGSLLGVGRQLSDHDVPVLGINRGGLGFLADISPDQLEYQVGAVLGGHYKIERHFLLRGRVMRGDRCIAEGTALNDVVVHPGTLARMMQFALFVDDDFVYEQRSDGLLVSTPTGSTAYALSAGGPIMHPNLDAIVVVPMFPHTLTSRPLVVRGECEIRIELRSLRDDTIPQVSFDTQNELEARSGDVVAISKKQGELQLLHPLEHSFFEACRSKLDWGSRLRGR